MIRDNDVNMFFKWCVNKNINVRRTKDKYRDILNVLEIVENIKKNDRPISVLNKLYCLKTIIKLHLEGETIETALSNVLNIDKYDDIKDFIKMAVKEDITDETLNIINKNIEMNTRIAIVYKKVGDIEKLSNILNDETYDDINEAYEIIKQISNNLKTSINKVERMAANNAESSITIGEESIIPTFERKLNKYRREAKIPTGFKYIDNNIMNGGLEKGRLYIIAGNSASGKSTMLVNMALNGATHEYYQGDLKNKTKLFLYLTLENDKEESLERIMCSHYGLTYRELDRNFMKDKNKMDKEFTNDILKNDSRIIVRQYNSKTISSVNLEVMIDELIEKYGGNDNCILAAIYVDYLDLLKSDNDNKKDWQMLVEITQQLKNLAINFEIPVVTATQLTRESYRVKNSWDLDLALIAEAIGKVNIADFVAIMSKDLVDGSLVHFRVGKFRCGNPDVPLDFKVNFEHYKFINCKPAVNSKNKNFGKPVEGGILNIDDDGIVRTVKGNKKVDIDTMSFGEAEF